MKSLKSSDFKNRVRVRVGLQLKSSSKLKGGIALVEFSVLCPT